MAWIVAPNIKALFASVNKLAPNRDRASDGTVGDLAHQQGTSGHNPDDYPGVKAERSDSDSIAEVRAGDIDRDLNIASIPGDDMERVVQTVIRTPALRNRLIYVIYNRRIWEASNGWRERAYTGPNPHDHHAHFSGHPDHDNDSAPWREIEALGDDMSEKAEQQIEQITNALFVGGTSMGRKVDPDGSGAAKPGNSVVAKLDYTMSRLDTLAAQLTALAGKDFTDEPAIVQGVLAGLTPEKIADAIPPTLAKQVADELTARLAE